MAELTTAAERRDARLQATYGITLEQYNAMLATQGGVCIICGREPAPKRPLVVDHNHLTGVVRGLLCEQCNTGIGLLGDDVLNLIKSAEYLLLHGDYGKDAAEAVGRAAPPVSQTHMDLQEAKVLA